jgi:hypothetical protein
MQILLGKLCHPCITFFIFLSAFSPTDICIFQAVKGQLERDSKLVGLVQTMDDVYSFVEASESFQDKVNLLEDTISRLLKQTVECAIFIREYTGHGFTGAQGHISDIQIFY